MNRQRSTSHTSLSARLLAIGLVAIVFCLSSIPVAAQTRRPDDPVILAHYYIWFEATSWNRAKIDFPAVGRYDSDQASVMREHVRSAKAVGIDGFIVSWKSTEVNDPRLEQLIQIAEDEDFYLGITYQGLDFNRDPLPPARVIDDLDLLIDKYIDRAPFQLFERPLVVWSGTWEYSAADIEFVTSARRDRLQILASEKNTEDYLEIADYVDGNLYYWSSVNPATFPGYPTKLVEMAAAVRQHDGLWIAPAAPGFNARALGGATEVLRNDGEVLRRQWEGALKTLPDAIGIISWNEFSENTHIEPSELHGNRYLQVVADLTGSPTPNAIDFDSSAPQGAPESLSGLWRMLALGGLGGTVAASGLIIRRRDSERTVTT